MTQPPKWARDLVQRVATDEGRDSSPALTWRRKRDARELGYTTDKNPDFTWCPASDLTSGCHYPDEDRIVVTAGRLRVDHKLVLLHELAHWLNPPEECHGPAFWDTAWRLYRRSRVSLNWAKQREYTAGAITPYRRSLRRGSES